MPVRNLPALTNVHNTNSGTGQNFDSRAPRESNVIHFYENEIITGSGYTNRRHRRSSRVSTGGSLPAVEKALHHPIHLPAVQSTSAVCAQVHTDGGGDADAGEIPLRATSPDTVLERFGAQLSSYEHREIYNYPHVYFVGPSAAKRSGVVGAPNNDGYDDDHGAYIQVYSQFLARVKITGYMPT